MGSEARRPRGNSGCGADAKDESPKQSWLSCGTAARREGPRPEGGVGSENNGVYKRGHYTYHLRLGVGPRCCHTLECRGSEASAQDLCS